MVVWLARMRTIPAAMTRNPTATYVFSLELLLDSPKAKGGSAVVRNSPPAGIMTMPIQRPTFDPGSAEMACSGAGRREKESEDRSPGPVTRYSNAACR
jgi:hypothetical protein